MLVLPTDLTTLSGEELVTLETDVLTEFDLLASADPDTLTDDDVRDLELYADTIERARSEKTSRKTRKTRAVQAASRVKVTMAQQDDGDEDDGEDTAEDDDEKPDDGAIPAQFAEKTEPEPEAAAPEKTEEVAVEGDVLDQEGKTVVAAATRGVVSVAGMSKRPVPRRVNSLSITAAADVPGFSTGTPMENLRDTAKAFSNRANNFPRTPVPDMYIRAGVATLNRDFKDGLVDTNRDFDELTIWDEAARESRLPGGSLVASGGWCAPSETLYDLCTTESLDGLINLPEIGISRGGIRFTKGPQFSDIYASAGFCQTEAEAIAGTTKPCVEVQCPPFDEIRLDVCGVCVQAPILTNAGYPELVQRWIEGTLVAQQHKESGKVIAKMVAQAGTAQVITGGAGSGFDTLFALEWVAVSQRYKYRLPLAMTIEVVAPIWVRSIIRADLALRNNSNPNPLSISDAQIDSYFAERGISVQWVYNWQDLTVNTAPLGCVAAAPATFQILAYPAGSFVKGVADVISLDAVYDTANLQKNMFTAVFAESGYLVANRCYDACLVTIPTCISGLTGGVTDGCLPIGTAPAVP